MRVKKRSYKRCKRHRHLLENIKRGKRNKVEYPLVRGYVQAVQ
jgi:hypothetical protein